VNYSSLTPRDTFSITVIKHPQTEAEAVAQDTQALEIGYTVGDSANSVIANLTFPTTVTPPGA